MKKVNSTPSENITPSAIIGENELKEILSRLSIEPRSYQLETVTEASNYLLKDESRSCLINSATGSGKTVMALSTLLAMNLKSGRSLRIGWSAMRRNLLIQAAEENKNRGFNLDIIFFSMFDNNPPSALDILVVDEAHHDATDSMANIHQKSTPKKVLGLSATPYRSDNAELSFEKVICKAGLWQLVREGFLALANHYTIPSWNPEAVAEVYIQNREVFGKSAMFFAKYEQCLMARSALLEGGVRCEIVTGTTDRYRQIEALENGDLDVLINMAILTEGFDCPSLQSVFVRPSVEGLTAQMCGRVLRQFGDLTKNIIQSKCTANPYDKYAPVNGQFAMGSEGKWNSLKADRAKIEKLAAGVAGQLSNENTLSSQEDAKNRSAITLLSGKPKNLRRSRGGRGTAGGVAA